MIRSPAGFDGGDRIKRYLDYYQPSYGVMMLSAGQFSPALLFAAGEQGVWYDPSDFSTMFQDAAGTTPVTAVEQPVGRILDKSGRGNHATQSTTASRPVLSARVNLLTYTEQFDNAAWGKASGTSVSANTTTAPDGTLTADTITSVSGGEITQSITGVSGVTYRASLSFAKTSGATVFPMLAVNGSAVFGQVIINTNTGVAAVRSGVPGATSVTVTDQNTFWRLAFDLAIDTTSIAVKVYPAASTNGTSFTGGLSGSCVAWGADLRPANQTTGLPAYQRIAAATDYDTTGFPYYLKFDGVDDSMATGTITPGIDKAQVFAGVRKLSDANPGFVAELSADWFTNAGSFAMASPDGANASTYGIALHGSVANFASISPYSAPITSVISQLYDIAGATAADEMKARVNGANVSLSGVYVANSGTGSFGNYALNIGRRNNASLPYNGHIYSLIVRFGANLNASVISQTETWVNGKTMAY